MNFLIEILSVQDSICISYLYPQGYRILSSILYTMVVNGPNGEVFWKGDGRVLTIPNPYASTFALMGKRTLSRR